MHSDILIIGGGIIGLSIARELRRREAGTIIVLERSACGGEASAAAAGMLSPDVHTTERDPLYDLCSASRDLYPSLAEELLDETGIDIELDRTGTLNIAFGEDYSHRLLENYRKQSAIGIAVETLSLEDILKMEPQLSSTIAVAAFYPNDWQVENRKLVPALRRYAELNAIDIRENTEVARINVHDGRAIGVATDAGRISADHTIIATGAWTSLIKIGDAAMPFNVKPIRGQIVEFQGPPGTFDNVVWTERGYVVPRRDGRVLAGSTSEDAGFDKTATSDARNDLVGMAAQVAPLLGTLSVTGHWSGLRPFAVDGLPILGPVAGIDGLTVATGHYRNGILLAPITARLVADSLLNNDAAHELAAFSPNRFRSAVAF